MIQSKICPNCFSQDAYRSEGCRKCGYVQTAERESKALPVGYILKNTYCLGRILGIGGFGITYLGAYMKSGYRTRLCAIKEYYPQEWAIRGENGIDIVPCGWAVEKVFRHGLEIFVNEARILQGLRENQTIVNIEDFFPANNTAYLVMEFVQGETLESYMKKRGQVFSTDQANWIVNNIAEALEMIHSYGLLHRDVSPDNIMMTTNGMPKLIDFGSTRQFVMNEVTEMSVLIKPGFAPLEQYSKNGKQGPWSDVYALASTYYYMVSGKKPLSAVDRCSGEQLETLHEIRSDIPPAISHLISRAMEMDYTKRIHSMREFVRGMLYAQKNPNARIKVPYVILNPGKQIRKWKFEPEQSIKIGRSEEECDICIAGTEFSRIHCEIRYDSQKDVFYVMDYSINGTYTVNGLIGKGRHIEVSPGEFIYLVSKENQFYLEVK